MLRIEAIDHVVIRVRDLERALRFYCDVLGCTVVRRRDDLGLVHLAAGRSMIDLVDWAGPMGRQAGGPPSGAPNMDHFALRVAPFDAAALHAYLAAAGAAPEEVKTRLGAEGEGPSVYLRDPDGNRIELKGPAAGPRSET